MVVHIASVAFTAGILYLAVPGSDLFSWHPTCMSVGFVLLVCQAIMVFSRESGLFVSSPRSEKHTLHAILNAFAFVSILFGIGAVYLNKEINNKKHFKTWHGKLGLATFVLLLGSVVGGVVNKYNQYFKRLIKPATVRIYHATFGMIVFVLAMTTVALATYSNWFRNRTAPWVARAALSVPLVLAVVVMRQVSQAYIPRMFDQRESELDAKARMVQEKVEAKLKKAKEKKLLEEQRKKEAAEKAAAAALLEESEGGEDEEEEVEEGQKAKTE